MARRTIAFVVMSLWLVAMVPAAQADTGDVVEPQNDPPSALDGFQAGTCTTDEPTQCSPETPELFFNVAAGHPEIGFTQYIVKHKVIVPNTLEEPEAIIKTLRVDLPPGLTVNPLATEQCALEVFEENIASCPAGSVVGREEVTVALSLEIPNPSPPPATLPKNFVLPPSEAQATKVKLFNLVPKPGEPALFGFKIGAAQAEVFLTTEVAWEDEYQESFTIVTPPPSPVFKTLKSRLVNFGKSGDGSYITNPTTCFSPELPPFEDAYTTSFRADSVELPDPDFPEGLTKWGAGLPPGLVQIKCGSVPFDPGIDVKPNTTAVDSPATPTIETTLPFEPNPETQSQSHLRNAEIKLPQGMGLNPSAATGLQSCSDAEFGEGVRREATGCPAGSKIGTAEVETPPLPAGALKGDVFLGEQIGRDPTSGEMFRIFVEAKSTQYGVTARLTGFTEANPNTGQLTAFFEETPQVPFTSVKVNLNDAKGVLSSPPTCSPATTNTTFEPWSTPNSTKTPTSSFTPTTAPGGGKCPTTMADRPFAPSYTAKSDNAKAAVYSPFRVHIGRNDGEQEIKGIDVTLPEGLTGKLKGIPYCSEDAIAAAAANSGSSQQANPACPASEIGNTTTDAGTGPSPLKIGGKAYLAGPYKGAPLSMVVVTPAIAGPFDLGNVVVRVALFVNVKTAQVKAVADPIPDVFGGVKLDLRTIDVNVDRSKFMLNPTNCRAGAVSGAINGGGANPTDPAAFSTYPVSAPYQANNCKRLGFRPKMFTRLFGGRQSTRRAKHPKLRAIVETRPGDANIQRAALALPRALFLDQGNIRTVCTRPQLASQTCPQAAIYGHAEAKSPLLSKQLKGPVYLTSSNHELPDLVADLRGQVKIQLYGVISSVRGGIKTVFNSTPDVPVIKFILRMKGGDRGLLVNSRNLCRRPSFSVMNLKAQNGKRVRNNRLPLKVDGCRGR